MSDPKVCVIMPVYNGEKTIRLALNSLLAQSYSNWECVITNDGSTDGTDRILSQLTDPRFKVIQLGKNVGRGAARQVCLDHAEGEYLCYLDADDFYHKDKIKEQVQVMEHDKTIDMVACGILAYDDNYKALNIRGVLNTDISGFSDGNNLPAVLPTAMIRLHKALTIKYNSNLNAGEDLDYFSQYLDGGRFVNIAKLLYYYYTGTTTKQKVLSYTWNELKRGLYLMRRKPMNGVKVALVSASKYLAYGTLIPILGLDYFIQKRGHQFTDEQEHTYYQILKELKNEKVTA